MEESKGELTCSRLILDDQKVLYARCLWLPTSFSFAVSDGIHAWTISPTGETVADRAAQWDQSVSEYLKDLNLYLSKQQPNSVYKMVPAENDGIRLSWTLEKDATKLEVRWRLQRAVNAQEIVCQIFDFLMESDSKIREELRLKTRNFEEMKVQVDKCLQQNKKLVEEKIQNEDEMLSKFVAILNSKKAKLRELRALVPEKSIASEKSNEDEDLADDTDNDSGSDHDGGGSGDGRKKDDESVGDGDSNVDGDEYLSSSIIDDGHAYAPSSSPNENKNNDKGKEKEKAVENGDQSEKKRKERSEITTAAEMLSGSTYTSAPRKRRLL